jgi:hypothetical protein
MEAAVKICRSCGPVTCRKIRWELGLILLVSFFSGCYQASVSIATVAPNPQWRSEQRTHTAMLSGPGISLIVRASSHIPSFDRSSPAIPTLGISLWFGDMSDGYQFNPSEVMLSLPSTVELRPWTIEEANTPHDIGGWECRGSRAWAASSRPIISVRYGTCIAMYFKTSPPSPEMPFSLRIAGLLKDGRPVEVPELQFRPGKYWVWDFLGR